MTAQAPHDAVTLDSVTDEDRANRRLRRQEAVLRRDKLLGEARRLINRAHLAGHAIMLEPGGYGSVFVMRPGTLDFIMRGPGGPSEGDKDFSVGDRPLLDNVPVYFSYELGPDQIILATEGWPEFGPND